MMNMICILIFIITQKLKKKQYTELSGKIKDNLNITILIQIII